MLLFLDIGPRCELPGLVHLFNVSAFLLLSEVQGFFPHGDKIHELIVLDEVLELMGRELLERMTIEERLA